MEWKLDFFSSQNPVFVGVNDAVGLFDSGVNNKLARPSTWRECNHRSRNNL